MRCNCIANVEYVYFYFTVVCREMLASCARTRTHTYDVICIELQGFRRDGTFELEICVPLSIVYFFFCRHFVHRDGVD